MHLTLNSSKLTMYGPQCDAFVTAVRQLLNRRPPAGWEFIQSSESTVVAKCLDPTFAYYKEYLGRSLLEGMKGLLRGSRCERARTQSQLLIEHGFRSPSILCWGHYRKQEFMITEGIAGLGFAKYIYTHWQRPLSKADLRLKRRIIDALAREIGRLHKTGIAHGDLRLDNILFEISDGKPVFYLIDNERNRKYRKIPRRLVKKNLVQVNMVLPGVVTNTDRLRFFQTYNKVYGRFTTNGQRTIGRRVSKKTLQRLRGKSYP